MIEYQDSLINIFRAQYQCPISKIPMTTPVVAQDGISYEERNILNWFLIHNAFPQSRQQIMSQQLFENLTLNYLINRVESQVPKIVSIMKSLKGQIKNLNIQNQKLKEQLKSKNQQDLEPEESQKMPQKTPQKLLLNTLLPVSMIPQVSMAPQINMIDQRVEERRSQRIRYKTQQSRLHNDHKENWSINREHQEMNMGDLQDKREDKQVLANLQKRKFIKKQKFEKPRYYSNLQRNSLMPTVKLQQQNEREQKVQPKSQISIYDKSIKLVQDRIKNIKEEVKGKQQSLIQVIKMVNENHPQNKIIEKLSQLNTQLNSSTLNKFTIQIYATKITELQKENQQYSQYIVNKTKQQVQDKHKFHVNQSTLLKKIQQKQKQVNKFKQQLKIKQIYQKTIQQQCEKLINHVNTLVKQKNTSNFKIQAQSEKPNISQEKKKQIQTLTTQLKNTKLHNDFLKQQIQQNHANDVKNQFKISQITTMKNGYHQQRDQLLTKLSYHHMTWMFIISIYQQSIFSYVKEAQINQNIIQENMDKLMKEKVITQKLDAHKLCPLNYSDCSSDSFVPPAKRYTKKDNPKITKAIKNLQKLYNNDKQLEKKESQMIAQINEQKMKQNKLKSEITSRIQLLQIMLSQKLKENPKIDSKAVKQVKNLYKKVSLLSKTLTDQTPWNLWNSYKFNIFYFNNESRNIQYGYQIDGACLLKILKTYNEKSLQWRQVKSIKTHNGSIDDSGWKYLVKYAHLLPNLTEIDLEGNKIIKVNRKDLESWKRLRKVNLERNPLNEESHKVINQFSNKGSMPLE